MELIDFLKSLPDEAAREDFADRCKTSLGHLRNIAYEVKTCGEKLALDIDRESGGKVRCESLRSDVDWEYLRSSGLTHAKRKRA